MDAPIIEKKKRGRKKLSELALINKEKETNKEQETNNDDVKNIKPPPKKRGRKPKGGKIIQQQPLSLDIIDNEPNIILHLKCSIKDINQQQDSKYSLNYNSKKSVSSIKSFNYDDNNNCLLNYIDNCDNNSNIIEETQCENKEIKNEISTKINQLKINLHKNNICDKRSSCFWCTCDFDNPPIFIPQNEFKNNYQVYGCFCSPECGAAYLLNEKIDSSIKFERYQLLNHIYGKIYNYTKNIKPAPNPYYLLDKYYGSLSIKEYRDLFKNEQMLIVVDKPLTHVFPELYEDNSDFILNQRTIPNNTTYKIKRKNDNTKTSIIDSLKSLKN
jgi:hypothetical protein